MVIARLVVFLALLGTMRKSLATVGRLHLGAPRTPLMAPQKSPKMMKIGCLRATSSSYQKGGVGGGFRRFFLGAVFIAIAIFRPDVLSAHPVPMVQAMVQVSATGEYSIAIDCDVAAYLMQATPGHLGESLAEELRTMSADELNSRIADAKASFQQRLVIDFEGHRQEPLAVDFPSAEALRQAAEKHGSAQEQLIRVSGDVPKNAQSMTVSFPVDIGAVSLKYVRKGLAPIGHALPAGAESPQLPLKETTAQQPVISPKLQIAREYLLLGFEHILPKGLDHILFVLALYLLSPQLKPLFWQVTSFTVAHSITLVLSSLGVVRLSPAIVEPLIALSIALIALENLFTTQLKPWRTVIVFAMGLIHGLGFADVLGELGLPPGSFLTALFSFNVGVELGQLAVILLAFATVGWFRSRVWYRARIVIPASCALAAIGLYWTFERTFC